MKTMLARRTPGVTVSYHGQANHAPGLITLKRRGRTGLLSWPGRILRFCEIKVLLLFCCALVLGFLTGAAWMALELDEIVETGPGLERIIEARI